MKTQSVPHRLGDDAYNYINADFSQRAAMHADEIEWLPSPTPGVCRRMLERIGGEVARATTIVRYDPGSKFPSHIHAGGEELLVLDGVFQDEHGDFPAGSYIRNPPQSAHAPGSAEGCTIFVKLWQFDLNDRTQLRVATRSLALHDVAQQPGVRCAQLYRDGRDDVRLETWASDVDVTVNAPAGLELLVIDGAFTESDELFRRHSWLRLPRGGLLRARAGPRGCRVWMKLGHLAEQAVAQIQYPFADRRSGGSR